MLAVMLLKLRDEKEARLLAAALGPDNEGHAVCKVEGNRLRIEVPSTSAMGLLRTLDDILECARATGLV